MSTEVDQVVARLAPDAGPGMTAGARELMDEITTAEAAAPEPGRRRWKPRLAIPLIAAVAAAATVLGWLGPWGAPPAAALDIRQEDGFYVIEVKDLYADPDTYQAQLRAVGLNITLRVVPSSPGFVGQVFPTTEEGPEPRYLTEIEQIQAPGECQKVDGCPIGIKIPVNFTIKADISLGREARPGEEVQSGGSFDQQGEPMHCVPYRNKTVAEVRGMLKERNLTIEKFAISDPSKEPGETKETTSVPDSWYVTGGYVSRGGQVGLFVFSEPEPQEEVDALWQRMGC